METASTVVGIVLSLIGVYAIALGISKGLTIRRADLDSKAHLVGAIGIETVGLLLLLVGVAIALGDYT